MTASIAWWLKTPFTCGHYKLQHQWSVSWKVKSVFAPGRKFPVVLVLGMIASGAEYILVISFVYEVWHRQHSKEVSCWRFSSTQKFQILVGVMKWTAVNHGIAMVPWVCCFHTRAFKMTYPRFKRVGSSTSLETIETAVVRYGIMTRETYRKASIEVTRELASQ